MKKYEFTGKTKQIIPATRTVILHQIRAVREFGTINPGDIGGWIEKEENLSHDGYAWVYPNAEICDNARISDYARIDGYAWVGDNAKVGGYAWVGGYAKVGGFAKVNGYARVRNGAQVYNTNHLLVIGPIGSRNDYTTFFRDENNEITVSCGCFLGKIDRFLEKVTETHADTKHAFVYRAAAELAKLQIDLTEDNEENSLLLKGN